MVASTSTAGSSYSSGGNNKKTCTTKAAFEEHFAGNKRVKAFDMQLGTSKIDSLASRNFFGSSAGQYSSSSTGARIHSIAWNCDGTRVGCGSTEKLVSVATADPTGKLKHAFLGQSHTDSVDNVAFHATNPHLLATASSDRTICLWDVRQPKKHTKLSTKTANLTVVWSPCGRYLVYGDKEDKLHVVDGRTLASIKVHDCKMELNEIRYDTDGVHLLAALGQGRVDIFRMPDLEEIRQVQAHTAAATCQSLAMSPDGRRFAVGASDALCSIWDAQDLICERAISRLDYPVRTCSFSYDSRLLAAGSEDHFIDISFVDDASRVIELPTDGETYSVAWHPRAYVLAFATEPADPRDRDASALRIFGLPS